MSEQDPGTAMLRVNRQELDRLAGLAEDEAKRGRWKAAAARLQSAARFAWFNHSGVFRDGRLERLASLLAQRVVPQTKPSWLGLRGQVVHVVTQAYDLGGHTRLIARWIENDSARRHSLVITGQQGLPVPESLLRAVSDSGGQVIDIGVESSSLMARAGLLAGIAGAGARAVILHIHPYDVVPSLALPGAQTEVVFLNHADHVFSMGMDVAHAVADIRPAGRRLSVAARGVRAEASALVPLPLAPVPHGDGTEIRAELGVPEDAVLMLSIASEYKFGAEGEGHFARVHQDLVARNPNAHLVVVGPAPKGIWLELSNATDGRARALGPRSDIAALYAAADIYLDSLPFSSLTSMLDAALRGMPVAALTRRRTGTVLSADDLSFEGLGTDFGQQDAYLAHLQELIGDPELRRQRGAATRDAVETQHLPPHWLRHVDALMELTAGGAERALGVFDGVDVEVDGIDLRWLHVELVDFQVASGLVEPSWSAQLRDAPYAPLGMRVRAVAAAPRGHRLRALTFLIPDAARSRIKQLVRR